MKFLHVDLQVFLHGMIGGLKIIRVPIHLILKKLRILYPFFDGNLFFILSRETI